jgi:hypothetical protein
VLVYINDLPKTPSGKIMGRTLKSIVRNEFIGDTMTLMNPTSFEGSRKSVLQRLNLRLFPFCFKDRIFLSFSGKV